MRDRGRDRGPGYGRGGGRYRARRDGPYSGGRGRGPERRASYDDGQPRRMYQRGYIAPPPDEDSPRKQLLHMLSALGRVPPIMDGMTDEAVRAAEAMAAQQVAETHMALNRILNEQPMSIALEAVWDVLLAKPHRAPYFAVLVSLMNNTSVDASESVVMDCGRRLSAALEQRSKPYPGRSLPCNAVVKAILRFECALAALGVASPTSVMKQLNTLLDTAIAVVTEQPGTPAESTPRSRQQYADFLVEAVLLALPWGGASLWDYDAASSEALLARAAEYLAVRPFQDSPELSPWLQLSPETTPVISCELSGAAFLPNLLAAVREASAQGWACTCVPQPQRHVDNAFNAGAVFDVPLATPPPAPPAAPGRSSSASKFASLYPPRGIWPILPPHIQRTPEDTLVLDLVIAQEYYMHVLHAYAANGKACVDELTTGVPVPFQSVNLLVELLISQMLLPAPPLMVFGYQSLLVRLVEAVGQPVAGACGGCMKTFFEAAGSMDVLLLHRVSDLLAWFLSNNNYQWPWVRWERVLDAPALNMQRRFCSLTLAKMIRLCANLALIQGHVLPQGDDRWLALIPASDQPTAPPPDAENAGCLQQPYEEIMSGLVEKDSEHGMEQRLRRCAEGGEGGLGRVLMCFMHTLLFRAKMSPYHTETLLNRYKGTLGKVVAEVNEQGGQNAAVILLDTAEAVWRCSSQRASLTVQRLVVEKFVSVADVLDWALLAPASPSNGSTEPAASAVPRIVSEDEATATMALETVASLFVTIADQAEAASEKVQEVEARLPKLQADAAKAEADMAAAQAQSEDADITDEGREALLQRIEGLTSSEGDVKQKLQAAQEALATSREQLQEHRQGAQGALQKTMHNFITSATALEARAATNGEAGEAEDKESGAGAHSKMMLNCVASFARQISAVASGIVDMRAATQEALEQCSPSDSVLKAISSVVPEAVAME